MPDISLVVLDRVKADKDKGKQARPIRLTPHQQRDLDALSEDQEVLQGMLIQSRLAAAAAMFEKAKAYPETSKEWTETIIESAKMFKEIADKYPTKGGGLFARYYEGRNYAALGKHELAVSTLAPLVVLDQKVPLAILLRSRALNTTLECLLAEKKFDKLDDSARELAAKVVADGDKTFALAMDEAKVTLATMRERLSEVKAAGSDANKAAVAKAAAGTARDGMIAKPLAADTAADLAGIVMRVWPDAAVSADAAVIAIIEAGALSRVQIAMDDDDKKAQALLEHPVYGPWTLVAANDPLVQQGSLTQATLVLAVVHPGEEVRRRPKGHAWTREGGRPGGGLGQADRQMSLDGPRPSVPARTARPVSMPDLGLQTSCRW